MSNETYNFNDFGQENYSKPMPWIGIYISVASLVCTLAMAADLYHGLRYRRFWFPCKFSSLNAASLTVLAVAMKLPLDINTAMTGQTDQLAKLSSTIFLCIVMSNFMPSIGPMEDRELLMNITALAILVITVAVNIIIETRTGVILSDNRAEHIGILFFMLAILVVLCFSALTISTSKKILETQYFEMHLNMINSKRTGKPVVEQLKDDVNKYWIMAQTSSPEFVMACLETCNFFGGICLFLTSVCFTTLLSIPYNQKQSNQQSDYKSSTFYICTIQAIGMTVGTIAPAFRCFTPLSFKLSMKWSKNNVCVFKIENYWTQRLVEWKETRLSVIEFGILKCTRFVNAVKNLILNLLIGSFTIIIVISKLVRFVALFFVIVIIYFYYFYKFLKSKFISHSTTENAPTGSEEAMPTDSEGGIEPSLYVLQLQDGAELSKLMLRHITQNLKRLIETARKQQKENLKSLLEKSQGFKGVAEFDSHLVPRLHPKEPPHCWSLTLTTLTSIAIALQDIKPEVADLLLTGVKEGLSYVKLIENSLTAVDDLVNVRRATDITWPGVEFHGKWFDTNLKDFKGKTSREILEHLNNEAKKILVGERAKSGDMEENDLKFSGKVIAANSMYRISQTVLQSYEIREDLTDEELFEKLSVMIAEIFCACLTNLPRVIIMKCYSGAMEKRVQSVTIAARLLGETEKIIELIQQWGLPDLDPEKAAYIDQWRACFCQASY